MRVPRVRCSVRWAMAVVFGLALSFALARPYTTPTVFRCASEILRRNAPGCNLAGYRPHVVRDSADGRYTVVKFVRVGGAGPSEYEVVVNKDWVRKSRFSIRPL